MEKNSPTHQMKKVIQDIIVPYLLSCGYTQTKKNGLEFTKILPKSFLRSQETVEISIQFSKYYDSFRLWGGIYGKKERWIVKFSQFIKSQTHFPVDEKEFTLYVIYDQSGFPFVYKNRELFDLPIITKSQIEEILATDAKRYIEKKLIPQLEGNLWYSLRIMLVSYWVFIYVVLIFGIFGWILSLFGINLYEYFL